MVQPRLPAFYEALQKNDPEFFKVALAVREKTLEAGALDLKTRTLINLALDATHGSSQGVKNLAQRARERGATEDEIREVMRLVYAQKGNSALAAAQSAFEK